MAANYDMVGMRKELIFRLASTLNKRSKFYKSDYSAICSSVNNKTRAELIESLNRQRAIDNTSVAEMRFHCQT